MTPDPVLPPVVNGEGTQAGESGSGFGAKNGFSATPLEEITVAALREIMAAETPSTTSSPSRHFPPPPQPQASAQGRDRESLYRRGILRSHTNTLTGVPFDKKYPVIKMAKQKIPASKGDMLKSRAWSE